MIDTNQLNEVAQNAAVIKSQLAANWPAICAAALWVRTELKNFNHWFFDFAEYSIAHGGIGMFIKKFFWNPGANVTGGGK
jgi:hypothetical protein